MRRALATALLLCIASVFAQSVRAYDFLTDPSALQFIWVGNRNGQFNDQQYSYIATHFSYVLIAKFHANWNIELQHQDALELKRRNPNIKIFPYFPAKLWFTSLQFAQDQFKDEWYLRDRNGKKVRQTVDGYGAYYVDITNAEYRNWALGIIAGWMNKTTDDGKHLYDGVLLDNASSYPKTLDPDGTLFGGLKLFITQCKALLQDRLVIGNGITDTVRSLALFSGGDVSVNENFGFDRATGALKTRGQIIQDLGFMTNPDYSGKKFFERVGVKKLDRTDLTNAERAQIQRFCLGSFLLGHQPGRTFFKYGEFGTGYNEILYATGGEIINDHSVDINPDLTQLDFGAPLYPYRLEGNVYSRQFENGWIYVNMDTQPQYVTLKETLVQMKGLYRGQRFTPGRTLSIPAQDALFMLIPYEAPKVSGLTDVTTKEDVPTPPLPFTVDVTNPGSKGITLKASSSNDSLVTNSGMIFGGANTQRTLQITPVPEASGTAVITVSASDGISTTVRSFTLTVTHVDDHPVFSPIEDQALNENTSLTIDFTIGDNDTPVSSVTLSAASSNPVLIPADGLVLGGQESDRTLTISPAPGQSGTATITIEANDGTNSAWLTFKLTVLPVNLPPTISSIPAQRTPEDKPITILFSVTDRDTPLSGLALSATSSNPSLVPNSSITFTDSGTSRAATITPTPYQTGKTDITLVVSDGELNSSTTFSLTVTPVNHPPVAQDSAIALDEDTVATGFLAASDVDGDLTTVSIVRNGAKGDANITNSLTGAFTYTPRADTSGEDSFTFQATDGKSASNTATVTITIRPVDDAPAFSPIGDQTVAEDRSKVVWFSVSDVDTPPESLIVSASSSNTTLVPNSSLVLGGGHAKRRLTITPARLTTGSSDITLSVSDGTLTSSATFKLNVTPVNHPPQAVPMTLTTREDTPIEGSLQATDVDEDPLVFRLVRKANWGTVELLDRSTGEFTYTPGPNFNGTDQFSFSVTDGVKSSPAAVVTITVDPVNDPPVAEAGPDRKVKDGALVTLNGMNSRDADRDIVSYQWVQTDGPPVELSDPKAAKTAFIAPSVDPQGATLTFQLTVTDSGGLQSSDTCLVNVTWVNEPPVADAGPDQTVEEGSTVILNGSNSSDSDDALFAYRWVQLSGPSVSLSGSTSPQATFKAPDVGLQGGNLTFRLTVTDKGGLSSRDECAVNVSWVNVPPTADAGPDQTVKETESVTLNGTGSWDIDDGIAVYQWTQLGGPPVTLSDPTAACPTFTAPQVDPDGASLVFSLTVTDRGGLTSTDSCVVNVTGVNQAPIADAGPDQIVGDGAVVTLNGSGSKDAEHGILSYLWVQTRGIPVTLSDPTAVTPIFQAPSPGASGYEALTFRLTVTDPSGLMSRDRCIVTVKNAAP